MTSRSAIYTGVTSPRDSISEGGVVWAHDGESRVGVLIRWGNGIASYTVNDALAAVEVRAKIRFISPKDRPMNAAGVFRVK